MAWLEELYKNYEPSFVLNLFGHLIKGIPKKDPLRTSERRTAFCEEAKEASPVQTFCPWTQVPGLEEQSSRSKQIFDVRSSEYQSQASLSLHFWRHSSLVPMFWMRSCTTPEQQPSASQVGSVEVHSV